MRLWKFREREVKIGFDLIFARFRFGCVYSVVQCKWRRNLDLSLFVSVISVLVLCVSNEGPLYRRKVGGSRPPVGGRNFLRHLFTFPLAMPLCSLLINRLQNS
jgi:hypothetical protein